MRLLLGEMRRALHRRVVRVLVALALVGCIFVAVVAYVTSGNLDARPADGHPAFVVDWWRPGTGDGFLTVAAVFLGLGAAIGGASFAGAEWRAGTITTMLMWEPRRVRLHLARTGAVAVLAFVIALLLQGVFLASVVPAVVAHGDAGGTSTAFWVSLAAAGVRIACFTALVAVLAFNIATLGRNTTAALVVLFAWAAIAERLLQQFRPGTARYLASNSVATFVTWRQMRNVTFRLSPAVALVTLVVYMGAWTALATLTFARRDVATA